MEDDPHDSTDNSSNENEDYVNKLRENTDKIRKTNTKIIVLQLLKMMKVL